MRPVPNLAAGSAVGVVLLVGLSALVATRATTEGLEAIVVVAVVAVSLPIGILLGFLIARRLWLKCMAAGGAYRKKPSYWWFPVVVLFSVVGFRTIYFVPWQIVVITSIGVMAGLVTLALGMALFGRRDGCRLSLVGDPATWSPQWIEYRVESRESRSVR